MPAKASVQLIGFLGEGVDLRMCSQRLPVVPVVDSDECGEALFVSRVSRPRQRADLRVRARVGVRVRICLSSR